MSTLEVSVIIATRDRPLLLHDAVASILAGEDVPAELIVVDQSRTADGDLSARSERGQTTIRYVWSQSRGLSRGRNIGIAAARCASVAFVDDDVIVSSNWLGVITRALASVAPNGVATGQVRPTDPEVHGGFAPSTKVEQKRITYRGRSNLGVLFPNNAALPRSAFHAVGLFDERLGAGSTYPSSEDNDLCFRLLEAGYCILYEPEAVVFHRAWRGRRAYLPLRWDYGRGQGAYYAKHFRLRDRYMFWRFVDDGRRHLGRMMERHGPTLEVVGEAAFVGGLVMGAVQWLAAAALSAPRTRATVSRPPQS
jgi:GT2 family glycosyltransferase